MYIDTDKIVTMTAANQNFSAVARQTDRDGRSVIFKNNRPKYILIDLVSGVGEMTKFSKDKVLLLHRYIASETGGSRKILKDARIGKAEANARCWHGFAGRLSRNEARTCT